MLILRLPSKVLTQRNCGVCAVGDVLLGLGCDTGQGYHFSAPCERPTWAVFWPQATRYWIETAGD